METPVGIKRGIDLTNRAWQGDFAGNLQKTFAWWRGGKFNRTTALLLTVIFFLNLFLVFPIFQRNVTSSFSSASLVFLAEALSHLGILQKGLFFSILTFIALSFSPISFYLFVRRMALRHELIAFLATIFFILPNPISGGDLPLVSVILNGDGAHAFAFAFIPMLLLYIQAFITTGASVWGVISAFFIAVVTIISPFAFFNLLIIAVVIAVADGFLGSLRIKLTRFLFLIVSSLLLSFFWYSPHVVGRIFVLSHVKHAMSKFSSVAPIFIPIIPVVGALSFLVFDRREKLRPFFVGISLFLIYFSLFSISKSVRTNGVFTADRYIVELSFASSFLFAIVFVLLAEFLVRNFLLRVKHSVVYFVSIVLLSSVAGFLVLSLFVSIKSAQTTIIHRTINNTYNVGIGNIREIYGIHDIGGIVAIVVSLVTFCSLVLTVKKFPSAMLKSKKTARSS